MYLQSIFTEKSLKGDLFDVKKFPEMSHRLWTSGPSVLKIVMFFKLEHLNGALLKKKKKGSSAQFLLFYSNKHTFRNRIIIV